jgi:hypothetical protein
VELNEKEVELNALARVKEVVLKQQEVEIQILPVQNLIMLANLTIMALKRRAWFEKKRQR